MTKVTIDRELLERELLSVLDFSESNLRRVVDHLIDVGYTRAAPRQQEGEGLEVVGFSWLDTAHFRRKIPVHCIDEHWVALCRLSDHQRAIAELRDRLDVMTQCADNYSRMFEESAEELDAAREILAQQGRRNTELRAERDTLRQQIAERDAQIASMRAEVTPFIETHWMPVARQRDKLAGLLRMVRQDGWYHPLEEHEIAQIDAALAEASK